MIMKMYMKVVIILFCISFIHASNDCITIAILAKYKAHTLPLYLECIEQQTWPKDKTYLYIRTNNNNDNTAQILKNWIKRVQGVYAKIYFDDSDVEESVECFGQHEWNHIRFRSEERRVGKEYI